MDRFTLIIEEKVAAREITEKHGHILLAAFQLFSEKGDAMTSTKEIARLAGVAEATIFKYYATKDLLILALVDLILEEILVPLVSTGFDELADRSYATLEDFFRALLYNRMQLVMEGQAVMRMLLLELPVRSDVRQKMMEKVKLIPIGMVVDRVKEQGYFSGLSTDCVVELLLSSMIGYILPRVMLLPEYFGTNQEQTLEQWIHFMSSGFSGLSGGARSDD